MKGMASLISETFNSKQIISFMLNIISSAYVRWKRAQAHGASISFPPPPFSLLPPFFSKFSYKSFLFPKPKNCGHRIHVLFMMYDVYWYCQMKKNEWLWKFWKRNDLYENFEKRVVVEKRGEEETKYMPHAPVEAGASLFCVHSPICNIYTTVFRFKQLNNCTRFTPRFNSKNRGINDL